MRKFFIFIWGLFLALGLVGFVISVMTVGLFPSGAISLGVALVAGVFIAALATGNEDLIPGSTPIELYRIRMLMEEQKRQRSQH